MWLPAPSVSLGSWVSPVLVKSCTMEDMEEEGLGFTGRRVGKDELVQRSESVSPGRVQSPRKAPSRRCALSLACSPVSLWQLQEQWEVKSLLAALVPWDPEAPEAAGQWFLAKRKRSRAVWPGQLGIDEGDGDVAGSLGGGEPLVVSGGR